MAALLPFTFVTCGDKIKTIEISGYVVNGKNSQPVEGIKVTLTGYDGYYEGSRTLKPYDEALAVSDATGFYTASVEGRSAGISGISGFCDKNYGATYLGDIEPGEYNDVNILLDVIDGKIKVVLANTSGAAQLRFDVVANCRVNGERASCCFHYVERTSYLGKTDTVSLDVSAGRNVKVDYANKNTQVASAQTVFCPENGEAYIWVEY